MTRRPDLLQDSPVRWVAVPSMAPSALVVGDLVWVRDMGSDDANRVAARNAHAAAQILKNSR